MDRVDEEAPPQQQALLAVNLVHVVWLKYVCAADDRENTTSHMSTEKNDFGLSRFPGEPCSEIGSGPDRFFELEDVVRTRWQYLKSWTCTK
jgi:hypothetical protein